MYPRQLLMNGLNPAPFACYNDPKLMYPGTRRRPLYQPRCRKFQNSSQVIRNHKALFCFLKNVLATRLPFYLVFISASMQTALTRTAS